MNVLAKTKDEDANILTKTSPNFIELYPKQYQQFVNVMLFLLSFLFLFLLLLSDNKGT